MPSNITPLSAEAYKKKFDQLINRTWTIQSRLAELQEFEKQWAKLFEVVRRRTGQDDPRVRIENHYVFRGFRWDNYRVTVLDLLSIIENEFGDDQSVTKQSRFHATIPRMEDVLADERQRKVTLLRGPNFPEETEEERARAIEEIHLHNARGSVEQYKKSFLNLFGEVHEQCPNDQQVGFLENKFRGIANKLKPLRQVFAHSHQRQIVERNSRGYELLSVETLKGISTEFFDLVRDLALIHHQSSYADLNDVEERQVSDQIDLMLFGSIGRAVEVMGDGKNYYWRNRELYFESGDLTEILPRQSDT